MLATLSLYKANANETIDRIVRERDDCSFRTYGVLLLLDLDDGAVLESPLDNVGLLGGALDVLGAGEGRPELGEVLDLDQVPDVGERGLDDGRLADGGGGGDGRHFESVVRGVLGN
jgi:hypothetical protein